MTRDRDFDRIAAAWLDLMPDKVPDRVVEEILEDVVVTTQARPPLVRLPWASPRTDRLMLVAVTVLLGAALLGGALMIAGGRPPTPPPPSGPAVGPTAGPTSEPATTGPAGALARALVGTWVADVPPDLRLGDPAGPARMSLVIDTDGTQALLTTPAGRREQFRAALDSPTADSLVFTNRVAGESVWAGGAELRGCAMNEQGTYRATRSPDGILLTLATVDDPCPSRAAVFGRTWVRSLSDVSSGGLGVVDAFDPLFTVDLPPGGYSGDRHVSDAITISQAFPEFAFLAFKDPQGFLDPCSPAAGRHEIASGADAVVAYFRQLRGFTVESVTEREVDGHRALRLVVHANLDASCPSGGLVEWQPKAVTLTGANWFLRPGDTDTLVIVELADATVMFQILPAPSAAGDGAIDSIRFLDRLPTGP
jgi:hypothetical protein